MAESTAPLSLTETEYNLDRVIDPLWVSRQSLEPSNNALKPGYGWLPPDWLFEEGMRHDLRH